MSKIRMTLTSFVALSLASVWFLSKVTMSSWPGAAVAGSVIMLFLAWSLSCALIMTLGFSQEASGAIAYKQNFIGKSLQHARDYHDHNLVTSCLSWSLNSLAISAGFVAAVVLFKHAARQLVVEFEPVAQLLSSM